MKRNLALTGIFACLAITGLALAQGAYSKAQVGAEIKRVEDGTDEFRKWAENRAEQATTQAQAGQAAGRTRTRTATEAQKTQARQTKDDLSDSLSDLNRSTNRLRRKFDPTDKWLETKSEVQSVLDDGRKINQVLVRGNYGTQAERYWSALRASMNNLARFYNLTPLGA